MAGRPGGITLNEHVEADGAAVFAAACHMGLKGIVSKRVDAPCRSGRGKSWIKTTRTPIARPPGERKSGGGDFP